MGRQRILCVVTVVAALVAATPAMAQRLSLGERVTRLENQANVENQSAGQSNLEQQNRMVQLQTEVQSLRNVVETLQNEIEQLKQRSREQYIDLDGRLGRIEGNPAAAVAFVGVLVGLAIPLAVSLSISTSIRDIAIWGVATVVLQLLAFRVVDMLLTGLPQRIEKGEVAAAVVLAGAKLATALILAAALTG